MDVLAATDKTTIGSTVLVKGELTGGEDLFIDGQVEGSIVLKANNLIIGPKGHVRATVSAKNITILGKLDGNIVASERTDLRKTAILNGDVNTQRISIEEGAFFQGKLEVQEQRGKTAGAGTD